MQSKDFINLAIFIIMIKYSVKQFEPNPFNFTIITGVILEPYQQELVDFAGWKRGQDFNTTKHGFLFYMISS